MIRRSPLRLAIAATATAVALSGCATFTNTDVVAQVDDDKLTTSEFETCVAAAGTTGGAVDGAVARGVVSNWIYLELTDDVGLVAAHDSGPDTSGFACLNLFAAPDVTAAQAALDRLRSGEDPAAVGAAIDPTFTGTGSIGCGPVEGFGAEVNDQLAGISIDDPHRIVTSGADSFVVTLQPRSQLNGIELLQAVQGISPETFDEVITLSSSAEIYVNPRVGTFEPALGGVNPLGLPPSAAPG